MVHAIQLCCADNGRFLQLHVVDTIHFLLQHPPDALHYYGDSWRSIHTHCCPWKVRQFTHFSQRPASGCVQVAVPLPARYFPATGTQHQE